MNLEITDSSWSEKGVTVALGGEIDVYTAAKVRQHVRALVESGRCLVVVSLENVRYLDSTGLGVLIGALRCAREQDGNVVIVCSQPRLLKIFEITGLTKIFRIFSDEESAQAALTH